MKTKERIKQKAIELFNIQGIRNVTLRLVALKLNKSYGNITYHYPTKERLLHDLFEDYNTALLALTADENAIENLLHYFLILPELSFDITVKYLFFFVDYTEIKRSYPAMIEVVERKNNGRKKKWMGLMAELQNQEFLQSDLTANDLNFIMQLSTGFRLFYFQETPLDSLDKSNFTYNVNRLLVPYLTEKGKAFYLSKPKG